MLCGLLTLTSLFVYVQTTAPTITWLHFGIDTGEWATVAARWTIPHPSGYPLYLLLGRVFAELPFGSLAHRLNLMSAVFGALAVGMVGWTAYAGLARLQVRPAFRVFGAFAGAGLLACSPTFWSQAVLAEVYTLHCFGIAALLRILLALERGPHSRPLLVLLGAAFGLAMDNHTTSLLFAPAIALFLAPNYFEGRHLQVRQALLEGGLIVVVATLALAPYLLLLVRGAEGAYPTLWDTSTPAALFDHFTGGYFRGILFIFPINEVLTRLLAIPRMLVRQFSPIGIAAIAAGIWALVQYDARMLRFVAVAAVFNVVFAINYPVFDSELYLLPVYVMTAVIAGWGTMAGLEAARQHASATSRRQARWAPAILAGAVLGAVIAQYLLYRGVIDVSKDFAAYEQTTRDLDALPSQALLLSGGPDEILAFWYLQYGEGRRQDVLVIDSFWVWLSSYRRNLTRQFPDRVPSPDAPSYLRGVVQRNIGSHPVLATEKAKDYLGPAGIPYTDLGNGMLEVSLNPL
jgi:hypothetical protein